LPKGFAARVGRANVVARARGHRVGVGTRATGIGNAEPVLLAPHRVSIWSGVYAAAFFAGFDAGFGAGFLVALAFSFAANSCLTVAEIASTSTL
jgi:hypothetical protein